MMVLPVLGMVLVALIWGSVTLFSTWSGLPSPVFVFYRVAIALPLVLVYALNKRGGNALKFTWTSALSGTFLAFNWVFFFEAVSRVDISTAALLYYFGPVFAVILSWILLKEEMRIIAWIPVVMAIAGILMIFFNSRVKTDSLGIIFGFLAGVSYGSLAVCGKAMGKKLAPEALVAQQLLISTIILSPFAFKGYHLTATALLNAVVVGIIHTGLGLIIWFNVLRKIPMRVASIFSYLDPIFATFLAWVAFKQIPSFTTLIGGGLIIAAGVIVSNQYRSELKRVKTTVFEN